ncbi:putative acetyl-CoA acetyltransferase cytosolic 2 [Citrus sinensis]|uniref:Acetyl-CoA acetyltransferase cytosolic 2 n=1 Tax=Citrus sinensis TaxID=2711 RepID=A0ACB8NKM7_CITSI|nr:putative acetyl-CoA acetyltransferase cytosolic 2 [Citrus sinensis]
MVPLEPSESIKARDVCIVGVARTPMGGFLGSLSSVSATKLGSIAIECALKRANVKPLLVQEVFFGNVLSANLGQAPARQAALGAGIPNSVVCTTINKVCSSGMKAVMLAAQSIQLGINDIVVAGGMESMSNAPKYLAEARKGSRLGHDTIVDGMLKDGLWDVYNDFGMGVCAEICANKHTITRDEQVEMSSGRGKPSIIVDKDEGLEKFDAAKLMKLRPSFKEGGSVTAGNASIISDGAAALVLVSGVKALELGLQVIAKIRGFADAAQAPEWFTTAPSLAIPKAIANAGLEASQIDYYEINEAFSVVAIANQKLLGLDPEQVNAHGGAVSLGHPLGCSGARILVTLLGVLRHKKGKYGVGGICNGGGGASALVLELIANPVKHLYMAFCAVHSDLLLTHVTRLIHAKVSSGSPRGEVGEIDTRAPFQSVKAAVSLFGEVKLANNKNKPLFRRTRLSSENVLDKETQLLLARKEIERTKKLLESSESTRARALGDLERAKRTMLELTTKLKAVKDSKESAIAAAEHVRKQAKQLEEAKSQKNIGGIAVERKQQVDIAREHYAITASKIDAAKQELNRIRQDFDAALEAKHSALQQAAEAQRLAKVSSERVADLRKQLSAMKEGIKQIKLAAQEATDEQARIVSEKDTLMQSYKAAQEAAENKLNSLKKEYDPQLTENLEIQLAQTTEEIKVLQKQMKQAHAAEMDSMRAVTAELNKATKSLQEAADEECSLRNLVASLKLELEDVQKECAELKEKEAEMEVIKGALMESIAKESAVECEDSLNEHKLELEKLSAETETAMKEEAVIKEEAEHLKQAAEAARMLAKEAEKNLQLALSEVEQAKASERKALGELNVLSIKPDSASNITISKEEFDSLNKAVEESVAVAEKKLAEAEAQLLVINARKNEADKKLEANLTDVEEIKNATEAALKSAETATAAQSMVEAELRRWRQQEEQWLRLNSRGGASKKSN